MFELYKNKIIKSFQNCNKGAESFDSVKYYWGLIGYFITFFILDWVVMKNTIYFFDFILCITISIYFSWHIYAIYKCKPKKANLSKAEKLVKKQQMRSERFKIILDKIFLRRSIAKFNAPFVMTIVNLYIIANYCSKIYY